MGILAKAPLAFCSTFPFTKRPNRETLLLRVPDRVRRYLSAPPQWHPVLWDHETYKVQVSGIGSCAPSSQQSANLRAGLRGKARPQAA